MGGEQRLAVNAEGWEEEVGERFEEHYIFG